jgi:hypothetical protein
MAEVVLNIKGDSSDAVRAISQVGNEFDKVNQANKKNTENYKQGTKQIAEANKGVTSSIKTMNSSIADTAKNLLSIGLAVASIKSLGQNVLETRAEFQKFEAVLTNTLGSKSQAQDALDRIQSFAAKTPFGVKELTEDFVKLANTGFKPTVKEMTKLGDLASSQGKSFDQLTEALIDAQTGEFERLKEFGIRAKKEGDKVTLSFKDQKVQVDNNNESIRNAILGFGELQGVAGGMSAISETLGGKISNLNDNFDALFNNLGENTEGAFGAVIDGLNELLSASNEAQKAINDVNKILKQEGVQQTFFEKLSNQGAATGLTLKKDYVDPIKQAAAETNDFADGVKALQVIQAQLSNSYKNGSLSLKDYEIQSAVVRDGIKDLSDSSSAYTTELNKQLNKTHELSKAQKKLAEENAKKAAEDEKKLRRLIEDQNVNAILNDQAREEAKAKLEYERKKKDIESSKASAKTKNEALISLDLEYYNKRADIENKYIDEKENREKESKDKEKKLNDDAFADALKLQDELLAESDKIEEERLKEQKKKREDQAKAWGKFLKTFGNELKGFLDEQISSQESILDRELALNGERKAAREDSIKDLESQLNAELELQRQGLANNVDAIRAEIATQQAAKAQDLENDKKIKEEKAKLAKDQLLVDSASQASSISVAIAHLIETWSTIPFGAGLIAAFAQGLSVLSFFAKIKDQTDALTSGVGFQTGGHTGNMGETEVAGVVHGREFVSTAKTTRRHRGLLEALHTENYSHLTIKDLAPLLDGTGVTFNKEVLKEIRTDQATYSKARSNEPMMLLAAMNSTNKKVDKFFQYVKNKPESGIDSNGNAYRKSGSTIKIIRKR